MAESEFIIDPDNGGGTDYTSLSAYEAAEATDLVSDGDNHVVTCRCSGGTADTDKFVIDGWTTGASNDIKVWTDPAESYRHAGVWATGNKYRLEVTTSASPYYAIYIQEEYVSIIGLQIELTDSTTNLVAAIYANVSSTSGIEISYDIIKGDVGGGASGTKLGIRWWQATGNIFNNIVYDFSNSGGNGVGIFTRSGNSIGFYNNTIHGCGYGHEDSFGVGDPVNCAVFGNNDDFNGSGAESYCASDDGDGTNSVTPSDWDTVFEDVSANDFRLLSTDTDLISAGTDDPGSGLYDDDIAGNARTSTWDIGADEYVAAGGGLGIPIAMYHYRHH